jgi:hypothetical protein
LTHSQPPELFEGPRDAFPSFSQLRPFGLLPALPAAERLRAELKTAVEAACAAYGRMQLEKSVVRGDIAPVLFAEKIRRQPVWRRE